MKNKIKLALRSRTVWSTIILFLISGFQGIKGAIPAEWFELIIAILAVLSIHFRVNPRAEQKIQ